MPSNSAMPILTSVAFGIAGFGLIFSWWWLAIIGLVGVLAGLIYRSLDTDEGYHVSTEEIIRTERAARGES